MNDHKYYPCLICSERAWREKADNGVQKVHCMRCGDYAMRDTFESAVSGASLKLAKTQVANISGFIRENPFLELTDEMIPYLKKLPTPSVAEKTAKLLKYLSILQPRPGRTIDFSIVKDLDDQMKAEKVLDVLHFAPDRTAEAADAKGLPFLAAAWAEDQSELLFLFDSLLAQNLIKQTKDRGVKSQEQAGASCRRGRI